MLNHKKYKKTYFLPPSVKNKWVSKEMIEKAPIWCSVDLRDGNQALVEPMNLQEKLEFFKLLVEIGFKEIEVGFPAASDTEFQFVRTLIEQNLIPDDVTIQVLTQAREHIIKKTLEAVKGAPKAVVHLYNSTSLAQREQVFRKEKDEIAAIAVNGAKLMKQLAEETEGNFSFEYTPESFSGTEIEYALDVCNQVLDVWQPMAENKVIINLPTTVENAMPHVFAGQVEYMSDNLKYRENVILSLHPHNDRGSAVSSAELGILAGADRIEGTLFGNGERTGNVDIVTLAMNLYTHGVDPELDFSNMPYICRSYERFTRMTVHERHPYSGALVFAAFSGSHQDAIAKGMQWRETHERDCWTVPYLPIDPEDIGREYDADVIRINSQSGKGGVGYILQHHFGINLPAKMKEDMGYAAKAVSDVHQKELTPDWIYQIFAERYLPTSEDITVSNCRFTYENGDVTAHMQVRHGEEFLQLSGSGNGGLDAVSNGLKQHFGESYQIVNYEEHALTKGSDSNAIAYVGIQYDEDDIVWGAAIDPDILKASINALATAMSKHRVKK